MTVLRQRMTEDMQVRNLSPHTQASYLQQVSPCPGARTLPSVRSVPPLVSPFRTVDGD